MNSDNKGGRLGLARMLLALAIVGAGYLSWVAMGHFGGAVGCGGGSGCDRVLQSRWADWLGLPVALLAAAAYVTLLVATLLARNQGSADKERGAWVLIIVLSVSVAGAALWFVGLQAFVIHAFCRICMVTHACGFAAALLCLTSIPLAQDPSTPLWSSAPEKQGVPGHAILSLVLIGIIGVGVLAGGQALFQSERNRVTVLPATTNQVQRAAANPSVKTGAQTTSSQPGPLTNSPNAQIIAPGILSLYGGQFVLRLEELPMMGSMGASNVLVYLFDYTCPHCRELHGILAEAQGRFEQAVEHCNSPDADVDELQHLYPARFQLQHQRLRLCPARSRHLARRSFGLSAIRRLVLLLEATSVTG